MIARNTASWLSLFTLALIAAIALDVGVFLYRQRHGDVLSFTTVKQYVAVHDRNGHYHFEYFGSMDISCVQALLPHQHLAPCWWVSMHHDHWE